MPLRPGVSRGNASGRFPSQWPESSIAFVIIIDMCNYKFYKETIIMAAPDLFSHPSHLLTCVIIMQSRLPNRLFHKYHP
jgi:hypothetical protein